MDYSTRNDFGKLFQEVNKLGIGAEIGVQNGFNSKQIATYWRDLILCVDVWSNPFNHILALDTLKDVNHIMVRGESARIADLLKDESLDWVYIDAGHSFEEVRSDHVAWLPKVRSGGIVSGHDYGLNGDCEGVKEYVDWLTATQNLQMNFTTDDFFEGRPYQSWWYIKK